MLNKKNILFILIDFVLSLIIITASILTMSFGTQNKISNLREDIVSLVLDKKTPLSFVVNNDGRRVESFIDDSTLTTLRMSFYNYATCDRVFDNNFYLSVVCDNKELVSDLSLLESVEKPLDSENFLIQGNLESVCSEKIKINGFSTNYGYLSNSDDAIYLPDYFGEELLSYFALSNLKELVFSENHESGFSSKVGIVLKNKLDDEFEYSCKLRGFYKSETELSDRLALISNSKCPLAICSSKVFDNITFNENKLACFVKYNANSKDSYYRLLDILSGCYEKHRFTVNFSPNTDQSIVTHFENKISSFDNSFITRFGWIFIIISILISISFLAFTFIIARKSRITVLINSLILLAAFLISLISLKAIKLSAIILVTNKGLFVFLPFLLVAFLIIFVRRFANNKQQNNGNYDFYSINI